MNILIAGIPRSGSTRLFNIVRLGLLQHFPKNFINSHWITTFKDNPACHNILKVHEFEDRWVKYADFIFTTKRDIRFLAASAWDHKPLGTYQIPNQLVQSMTAVLGMYESWKPYSDYEIVYEKFSQYSEEIVSNLFSVIGLPVDVKKLLSDLDAIKNSKEMFNEDGESLMHTNHISEKTSLNYRDRLPEDFYTAVETTFMPWLEEHEYIQSEPFKFL